MGNLAIILFKRGCCYMVRDQAVVNHKCDGPNAILPRTAMGYTCNFNWNSLPILGEGKYNDYVIFKIESCVLEEGCSTSPDARYP